MSSQLSLPLNDMPYACTLIWLSIQEAPFRRTKAHSLILPLHPCQRWRMKNHFWWISMTRGGQINISTHHRFIANRWNRPLCWGKESTRERILIFFFSINQSLSGQIQSEGKSFSSTTKNILICLLTFPTQFSLRAFSPLPTPVFALSCQRRIITQIFHKPLSPYYVSK